MVIGIDGNEANVTNRVGSNQYAFELLHALRNLPEAKRHEWIIYLREPPILGLPRASEGWEYKVFGPKRFWTQLALPFSLLVGLPAGRQGGRPDVFFSPGHYAPRWSPVPTVVSIMDLGYLKFPEQFTKRDLVQLTKWTARSIKVANRIIAISESTKEDVIKYYGTSSDRITVTYPGYDKNKFRFKIDDLRIKKIKRHYKIKNDYILFLGTLKPSKNIEGLLSAYHILIYDHPELNLVIAGKKGWMYEPIFRRVKKLGLEDKIIFTDFVPDEDVPALMAGAKVFVLPSFWEGFGIPVIEAMAVGTPVVASNVGSLPEVVGDAGVLVDPHDYQDIARGIKKALEKHDILSKKGLAHAKQFSWQKTAKQTLGVLERIASTQV